MPRRRSKEMVTDHEEISEREQRLGEIVFACLQTLESGRSLDQQEVLARYPEFAADLGEFFAGQHEVDRLATPLRAVARMASVETSTPDATAGQSLATAAEVRAFGDYEILERI